MDTETHEPVWHLRKELSRRLLDLAFPMINEGDCCSWADANYPCYQ